MGQVRNGSAKTIHFKGITSETERKRLSGSVSRAENEATRPKMTIPGGLARSNPGISATASETCRTKPLILWPNLAILQREGTPLGKCRLLTC
jgi:hypothetical protein